MWTSKVGAPEGQVAMTSQAEAARDATSRLMTQHEFIVQLIAKATIDNFIFILMAHAQCSRSSANDAERYSMIQREWGEDLAKRIEATYHNWSHTINITTGVLQIVGGGVCLALQGSIDKITANSSKGAVAIFNAAQQKVQAYQSMVQYGGTTGQTFGGMIEANASGNRAIKQGDQGYVNDNVRATAQDANNSKQAVDETLRKVSQAEQAAHEAKKQALSPNG